MTELAKDKIIIFNRNGISIVEFRASVARSWVLNDEGRASFNYPVIRSNVVNKSVLEFGNYILIINNLLPEWAGIIDTPRVWNERGQVEVNAYTTDRLFNYRIGANDETKMNAIPAGALFKLMVKRINDVEPTIMQFGKALTHAKTYEQTWGATPLVTNLRSLLDDSGEECEFVPVFANGKLSIQANWYTKIKHQTKLVLHSGGNMENPTMSEDGDIINYLRGYGDGEAWASRPKVTTVDNVSKIRYGMRQAGKEWFDIIDSAGVQEANNKFISINKNPVKTISLKALNFGTTFQNLAIGNIVKIQLANMGFGTPPLGEYFDARIIGLAYNPIYSNKIDVVVEEYFED